MTFAARFGVDFLAIYRHFEAALASLDQSDAFQVVTIPLDQLARQTDGTWSIGSFLAVEDFYFHSGSPSYMNALATLKYTMASVPTI